LKNCEVYQGQNPPFLKCYSLGSTGGNINSTDVGKFVTKSSNHYGLAVGSSSYQNIVGYVAAVSGSGVVSSTNPFYVAPFKDGNTYAVKYSTLYSANHPTSTSIGMYVGLSTAATIAGAVISMASEAKVYSSTGASAPIFRINGYSTAQRRLFVEAYKGVEL